MFLTQNRCELGYNLSKFVGKMVQHMILVKNIGSWSLVACLVMVLNFSCQDKKAHLPEVETTTTIAEKNGMNLSYLLGTWVDSDNPARQFSLYNDGSVDQKSIEELELKDWTLEDNELVFARKNSDGDQTAMNRIRYKIVELTQHHLTLENAGERKDFDKK